jgi:pimeloyl-ACP methyl ester carboxylesterase
MEKLFTKGLKIELVPSAGHFVHQERPEYANELMLKFLKS